MLKDNSVVRARAALLAALTLCAACGGGGGGGGGGTVVGGGGGPPPPPPGPPAVTITTRAEASPTTIKEGRPFTLSSAGSAASDGSTLTYAWSQVSGPAVTIASPNSPQLTLVAGEVTTDTPAQFRLMTRTGAVQSETLVNVTFANMNQLPTFRNGSVEISRAKLDVKPRVLMRLTRGLLLGSSEQPTDPLQLSQIGSYASELRPMPLKLPTLQSTALFDTIRIHMPAGPITTSGPNLVVLDESDNRVRLFASPNSDGEVWAGPELTIDKPCVAAKTTDFSAPAMVIGQKTGFTVVESVFATPTIRRSQITDEPVCVVLSPRAPIDRPVFSGSSSSYVDVVTFNPETNMISVYRPGSGSPPYHMTQRVQAQLNTSKPLKLVAWSTGDNLVENAMALVFSDGEYEGEHRLVIVGVDETHALVQRTHSWTGAAPETVVLTDLTGDLFPEVMIFSRDSPQAVVFEATTRASYSIGPLGPPGYFEIGLGATAAVSEYDSRAISAGGTMIAFADQKIIKVFNAAP